MHLDDFTLATVATIVVMLSGAILIVVWAHMRREVSLLWMATAHIVNGAATFLILIHYRTDPTMMMVGVSISSMSAVFLFASARVFVRGSVRAAAVAVPILLLGASQAGAYLAAGLQDAVALAYVAWIVLLCATSLELWRWRDERLPARWGLIALFLVHAGLYAGGLSDLTVGRVRLGVLPDGNSWLWLMYFEGLLYAGGTATLMALMGKERGERLLKQAARTDALTGASSRRAFFATAERALARCRHSGAPLSVIVFDLDRFKSFNDNYGHQTGDRMLVAFADIVRSALRPSDLFGRHGGEEFAVVLPGTGIETACVIAERIRYAFGGLVLDDAGHHVSTTVSAGVAAACDGQSIQALLDVADGAMYRAKNRGRNRVERAADDGSGDDTVVRVA